MNKKYLVFGIFGVAILALILARVIPKGQIGTAPKNALVQSAPQSKVPANTSPVDVALSFYQDYLNDDYGSSTSWQTNAQPLSSGGYRISDSYLKKFIDSGSFSDTYLTARKKEADACNEALATVSTTSVEKCGCFPEELAATKGCAFSFSDPFLGGDAIPLNKIGVVNSQTSGTFALVVLSFGNGNMHPDRYAKITLEYIGDSWKIDDIQTSSTVISI